MGEEKGDEKEIQKREEKEEEKRYEDPVSAITWAAILIWGGVVLLASNLGLLEVFSQVLGFLRIRLLTLPFEIPFISPTAWSIFFLGAGSIVVVEILVRLLVPNYRRRLLGSIIGAAVLYALAVGTWDLIWPLIVIAVGLGVLVNAFVRRR